MKWCLCHHHQDSSYKVKMTSFGIRGYFSKIKLFWGKICNYPINRGTSILRCFKILVPACDCSFFLKKRKMFKKTEFSNAEWSNFREYINYYWVKFILTCCFSIISQFKLPQNIHGSPFFFFLSLMNFKATNHFHSWV